MGIGSRLQAFGQHFSFFIADILVGSFFSFGKVLGKMQGHLKQALYNCVNGSS